MRGILPPGQAETCRAWGGYSERMALEGTGKRGLWSSQAGFIAASVGSAVGLGNVWRFPYVAGENGGGAFVLAYLISVVLLGVPLMMFEFAAGRRHEGGAFGVFRAISSRARIAGAAIAAVGFFILSYYTVVAGWTLGHAGIMALGIEPDFQAFSDSWASLGLFIVAVGLTGAIALRGIQGGIETASRLLLPILTLALLAIAAYSLTLEGRSQALEFLFQPRFDALTEPRVWANAMGQAMFSLGVGTGVLVTYGGYMRSQTGVRDSTALIAGADTLIAMIAGIAVFPIVFTFAVAPAAGPELAFDAMPLMFERLAAGRLIGTAFYLLLFFAALTSMVSMLEGTAGSIADALRWTRAKAVWVLLPLLLGVGTFSALSYSPVHLTLFGEPVLDRMDAIFGTFGLMLAALVTAIVLFWVGKPEDIADEIGAGARGFAGRAIIFVGRYLATGAIIATLLATLLDS
jgi:neurotransmitter:Na+ symporter, NSS family